VARFASVVDLIGNTPMLDISQLSPNPKVTLFVKLEGYNPGGSVKDRIARSMVLAAEADGSLRPGQVIVESSSGNTGIGLALVARARGYKLKVVLPENVSPERRQLLEIYGAEIISSPGSEGSNGAVKVAQKLAADNPEWWYPYQYANPANVAAHYDGTGPEIWRDCPEVTHFIAGLGTSGTLLGVGRYLKEQNPAIQIWAVEPPAGEMVDGLKNLDEGYIPPIFIDFDGADLLSRKKMVGPRDSIEGVRTLASIGVLCGLSTGAAFNGAYKCANEIESGVVVFLSPDGAWKYLSSEAWTGDIDEATERARKTLYF
jgi:cysteine synthase B